MNLSLFESRDALGFITSDSPCVWLYSEVSSGSQRSIGLGSRTIEVTLPISPSMTLALTWQLPPVAIPCSDDMLLELNRRTLQQSRTHFVTRTNETRAEWFTVP